MQSTHTQSVHMHTHMNYTCSHKHTYRVHTHIYTQSSCSKTHTLWKVLRWRSDCHSLRSYSPNQHWALWLKVFSHPPWWQQLNACLPIFPAPLESTVLSSFCFKGKWPAPNHASVSRWSQMRPVCWWWWTSLPLVNTTQQSLRKCTCEHPGPATPVVSAHKCLPVMRISAHHTSPGIKWCSEYSRPLTPFQIYCIYLKTTNILNYFHTAQDHNLLRGMSYQVSQGLLQNVRSKRWLPC